MKKKKKKLFHSLAEKYRDSQALCKHFGKCGGCMFQDISYENQLLLKKEYLNGLLGDTATVDSVAPAEPFRYRARMDMVTAFGKTGLREENSYRHVVDIEECPLMQTGMEECYTRARALLSNIEGYDYLKHRGYLRYIVLRQARFTGEIMLNLVVSATEDRLSPVAEELATLADSVSVLLSPGLADLSFGEIISNIKKGCIEEDFDGIRYRISPNSFFQSNPLIAREMYRRIKTFVKGEVTDLYCGAGSISLFVADAAESVTGVELSAESVAAAETNKKLNAVENANFICMDAKEHTAKCDTLILDPPRSGIHPSMLKRIHDMSPERIIYMSCNPVSFKENADSLEGYKIHSFEAFDMFPQTPHVETLALLIKK